MSRILVTGAGGFVGTALCRTLVARGHDVVGAVRRGRLALPGVATVEVGDVGPDTDWGAALAGVETVVHLAARVHVMNDRTGDPLAEYRRVNVDGSRRLAERAATAGVRRLVHVSSVKVHGDASLERPFTERDPAAPGDPYGISKAEAENAMAAVAAATGDGSRDGAAAPGLRTRRQGQRSIRWWRRCDAACRCRWPASSTGAA